MKQSELFTDDKEPDVLTVAEITEQIQECLEDGFASVWIVGEVSNLRRPASGHIYFTLKDDSSQLRVVMFRNMQKGLRFDIEDGLRVKAFGDISVYSARGEYQLIARKMTPDGLGPLQQAFLKLKEKLEKEGLFDADKKKALPPYPTRVALVTSPTSAAVIDMLRMIRSRSRQVNVTVYPVKVQGDAAAGEIASAIEHLNRLGDCDVIIAGRGGGSLEDLWAFNEECVARAIHASHIPVVSAVGHEIDFTISDLVADVRALTPTQVGELVVPSDQMLAADVLRKADDASQVILRRLENARGALRVAAKALATRTPIRLLREKVQRVDDASARITVAASHRMVVCREKVKSVSGRLEAISPVAVLDRGYSVTLDAKGKTVRSSDKIHEGDTVSTVLSKGRITSRVTKSE